MIDLNFLPLKEQKTVSKDIYILVFRNILVWFVLTIIISSLLLLWSKFVLERNLANWQEQSILVSSGHIVLTDQIAKVNKDLKEVMEVQTGYIDWSMVLAKLASLVPANNMIESLQLDAVNNQIILTGFSQTREDLLNLETNLSNSPLISDLKSPLTNLLIPDNISFQFQGKINLNKSLE